MPAADRVATADRGRAAAMVTAAGIAAWARNDEPGLAGAADRVVALVDDTSRPASCAALLAFGHVLRDDFLAATSCADRAVTAAEHSGRAADLSLAGAAAVAVGDDVASLRLLRGAYARASHEGAIDTLVDVLAALAMSEAWTGHIGAARTAASDGLARALQMGHHAQRALYDAILAWIAAMSGDADACADLAVQAARRGVEHEVAPAVAIAEWARGLASLGAGRPDEAHVHLSELARRQRRTSHPTVATAAAGDVVEAAIAVGDEPTARAAIDALTTVAAGTGQPWARAIASRCQALTCPPGDTEQQFAVALRHHDAGSRPFEHGRTLLAYGEWLRRHRRRIDARTHLRAAAHTFERVGANRWKDRARRELRASGGTTAGGAPSDPDALTPQEAEVVRFVRTGATNKQIAAQLYLSPRTIDYHLRKVFVKLEVSSRAELIARTADVADQARA
jgi:DNA-binding CsgD family transcriptional regulator